MPARRRHTPTPLKADGLAAQVDRKSAEASPPPASPIRPILRKKKSVTFHPSTRIPASQQNTPKTDTGTWSTLRPSDYLSNTPSVPTPATDTGSWPPKLLDYSHLPAWRHDNAHVLSSYRPQTYTHLASTPSLFYLHNESCNIWSHLLGLCLFIFLGITTLSSLETIYPSHTPGDRLALLCFFTGICTCLAASASFHLFKDIGPREARIWNGIDYAGIVACIWGSFVASLHFGFGEETEHKTVRRGYEGMITLVGMACVVVSLGRKFRESGWRTIRAGMFVAMGLSAVVPVGHGLLIWGWGELEARMGLGWVVRQGVLYVVGAGLYAARVPERWAPGRFDVWGTSHQIFHLLVVFAALAQRKGLMLAMDYKHDRQDA